MHHSEVTKVDNESQIPELSITSFSALHVYGDVIDEHRGIQRETTYFKLFTTSSYPYLSRTRHRGMQYMAQKFCGEPHQRYAIIIFCSLTRKILG